MSNWHRVTPLLGLLLSACSGISDQRPEPLRDSEYFLEHGVSAFENSDYVAASDFLRKALAHYRSIDNTAGILLSRINLAETALAAGNFDAAAENIEAAEKISHHGPFTEYLPRLTLLRAQVTWREQQTEEAIRLLQALLPTFDEEQNSKTKPTLLLLGAVTLRTDIAFMQSAQSSSNNDAELWLRRLSRMLPATPDNSQLHYARLLRFEAQQAYRNNDSKAALEKLELALFYYREAASRPAIAATLTEIGELLVKEQQWDAAEERLQRALYIRLWILDRIGARKVMRALQSLYLATNNPVKAENMAAELARKTTP